MKKQQTSNYMALPGIKALYFTPEDLISKGCEYFKISEQDIKSRSRKREIVRARQILIKIILDKYENISQKKVGLLFTSTEDFIAGKVFDHATAYHSWKTITQSLEIKDKNIIWHYEGFMNVVRTNFSNNNQYYSHKKE